MDGAFAQLSMLGSSVVLIAGFLLLWRRGLSAHIDAFTLQSVALGATTGLVAYFTADVELYWVAGLLIALKGIGIPLLLRRMARRFGTERELAPYVNTATSLLIGGLLVLLAYIVMRPIVQLSPLPSSSVARRPSPR